MSDELRFSLKLLFKKPFWRSLILPTLRKPVKPTLRLSKAALETPLPEGFLSNIREFLTRSGSWKGHPTDSVEAFMTIPAPGVSIQNPLPSVIGIDEPVFTSLGFGMEGIKDGVVKYATGICEILNSDSQCDAHICITQAAKLVKRRRPQSTESGVLSSAAAKTCYDSFCNVNTCGVNKCKSLRCDFQNCTEQTCTEQKCDSHHSIALTSELETDWKHPFVQELARYFGVDMRDDLAAAVMHYVGRNMFDESAR
jgi:hypothetical protein